MSPERVTRRDVDYISLLKPYEAPQALRSKDYKKRVAIIYLMLYNGIEEMIYFEVDAETNLHNASPGFSS